MRELVGANDYTDRLIAWRAAWLHTARPNQLPPAGDWRTWLIMAGRGFGKTRPGSEETGFLAATNPKWRLAVVAPTQGDVRRTCFEGESGLLEKVPEWFLLGGSRSKGYRASDMEIHFRNGSVIQGFSAEKGDRIRGPQFHWAWGDEYAAWGASSAKKRNKDPERLKMTYDNLMFALRLGDKPRTLLTTTPRPIKPLRELVRRASTITFTGSTFENAANLAPSALDMYREVYEGTTRGRQELHAEILSDNDSALWKSAQLDSLRVRKPADQYTRIVVAIDPAVTSEDDSDETGIIVAGLREDRHIDVLADLSGKFSPREWARIALQAYSRFEADCIVGEKNQGGDLVESNLRAFAEDLDFAYEGVHAKRGKYLRAEPIAAYYEKGKVHHVGAFPALEEQMTDFTGSTGDGSPDRLDALVYAVGELMEGSVGHAFW